MHAHDERVPALIGPEEARRCAGRRQPGVHLVQVALPALEAVLRLREVAQLGIGLPGDERLALVLAERVDRADQPRLVRVDDAPVAGPDLDSRHALAEDALL